MKEYIVRSLESGFADSVHSNPVTAVLGPRQAGKSTMVRHCLCGRTDTLFLDLDLPSDLRRLADPEMFLRENTSRLICIDEVQLKPDLFPVIRAMVDAELRPGRFVILGSASQDLIRQTTETLAGRIHYLELPPFTLGEIAADRAFGPGAYRRLWWRGGFPPAFLADDDRHSSEWRLDLVRTFLSRDLPQFGFQIPAVTMERFWRMLAHYHGGVLNSSKLGQALDVSHVTVRRYLDILEQTFVVRVLRPLEMNVKKRLVKSPKVYIRDSGLLHTLLEIDSFSSLFGHPVFGASWEGWCIEQIIAALPAWRSSFYRTATGDEVDLILDLGQRRLAFEFKASTEPHLSRGFSNAIEALAPLRSWIVCPMETAGYPLREGMRVTGIAELLDTLRSYR